MKKNLIYYTFILSALFLSCDGKDSQTADTDWPKVTAETKPWTRWWWMGSAVDEANLTYNLEEMAQAGIGGVEITPIYGVKQLDEKYIDYLSPQWMKMLAFTEKEAARLGMEVDMSNGTGWPFGGPEVAIEDAATKAIFQEYELKRGEQLKTQIKVDDKKQKDVAYLSRLMAYSAEGGCEDVTNKVQKDGILSWIPDSDTKLIALFVGKTFQQVKRAAPGGQGYVLNHFDKDAVKRYLGKFDKAFESSGTNFPHSFFNDSYEVYGADWTPDLLEQFEKRRGYKLEDHLNDFLAGGSTDTSVRIISDYRETIGEILKDNFTTLWTEWAHNHKSTTRNQAHGSPANLIDIYASVDIPECESFGITDFDIPYLRKDSIRKENDGDPTTLKYASSAAHIAGKKYTSSETFTWLTEHFRTSLSQCKPEIDQMFLSGVNHVYFHGATYSPKEAAWPGWKFYASVDMSPTNSIWRDAPAFFSYITRAQSFLQDGNPDSDFLLYLPIYDIWANERENHFLTFAIHGMRDRLPEFYRAVGQIRECGYDLDYISDHFINSTIVENGMLKTEGGAYYKALILPAAKLIPLETMSKIKTLIDQGAKVVFAENYPSDVPGFSHLDERRSKFNDIMSSLPAIASFNEASTHEVGKGQVVTGHNFKDILKLLDVPTEKFITDFGGQLIRRSNKTGHHYFFAMLQNKPVDTWVPLAVKAKSAMFFDPMTGKSGKAKLRDNNGQTEVYMQLAAGESIILKTFSSKDISVESWKYYESTKNNIGLTSDWTMTFVKSEPEVKSSFRLNDLISWTELDNDTLPRNMGTARYKTTFKLSKKENAEYRLCLGDVRESARVFVNGKEVATLFAVPFEAKIGTFLQNGENLLEVDVTNLPANRIADYDRRGVEWRIFNEINFVSITYQPELFDKWYVVPSGLLGPVMIKELKQIEL